MTKKLTMTSDELRTLLDAPPFTAIDRQFARYLIARCNAGPDAALAGAMTTAILASGHSCLDFEEQCRTPWESEEGRVLELPEAEAWIRALENDPSVGAPGDVKPLILVRDRIGDTVVPRLYLYKYFNFEKRVAERLRAMSAIEDVKIPKNVVALAKELFADEKDLGAFGGQLQTAGALLPFYSRFSIITGGPGTGKTTVLASMLALLCAGTRMNEIEELPLKRSRSEMPSSRRTIKDDTQVSANLMTVRRKTKDGMPIQSDPLPAIETIDAMFPVIQLAAPTGKAAQRMGESIRRAADRIPDEKIRLHLSKIIPSTIHRLLGLYGDSPKPKRNHQSPIDADIVVID
ncbi:MAG TPA: AAA family ATPase, partial [Bacteroidota bacterium]|nr:AAA family ATPase [Bacteroidota bacterium]